MRHSTFRAPSDRPPDPSTHASRPQYVQVHSPEGCCVLALPCAVAGVMPPLCIVQRRRTNKYRRVQLGMMWEITGGGRAERDPPLGESVPA
eukprot:456391-Prymnesium_polylepis.1